MWADIFTDFERRETLGRAMMMRRIARRRQRRTAANAAPHQGPGQQILFKNSGAKAR
jgi:hypothetical protein